MKQGKAETCNSNLNRRNITEDYGNSSSGELIYWLCKQMTTESKCVVIVLGIQDLLFSFLIAEKTAARESVS